MEGISNEDKEKIMAAIEALAEISETLDTTCADFTAIDNIQIAITLLERQLELDLVFLQDEIHIREDNNENYPSFIMDEQEDEYDDGATTTQIMDKDTLSAVDEILKKFEESQNSYNNDPDIPSSEDLERWYRESEWN